MISGDIESNDPKWADLTLACDSPFEDGTAHLNLLYLWLLPISNIHVMSELDLRLFLQIIQLHLFPLILYGLQIKSWNEVESNYAVTIYKGFST